MAPSPTTILEIGATFVGLAGFAGAFYAGYKSRKSTDTSDANETIALKDNAISALRTEVAELTKRVDDQDKKIDDLTRINNMYIRLFSGDPSRLEEYMKSTADAIGGINTSLAELNKKVHSAPAVTINN